MSDSSNEKVYSINFKTKTKTTQNEELTQTENTKTLFM